MIDYLCTMRRKLLSTPFILLALASCFFTMTGFNANELSEARSDAKILQLREFVSGYAQNFTGVPYRHAGTSPRAGFDCSGFTSYILKEFDIKVSPASRTQAVQGDVISLTDVLPGDLVFFGSKKGISHVAMVVACTDEGILCVHSTCSRGVIVENISTSDYWRPKMLFARDVISRQAAE